LQLITGRVLQFDHERGYGFIAADDGGEDVFLHASVLDGDSYELAPGMRVEFKVMAGDRGRKAFAAHLIDEESASAGEVTPPQPIPSPASFAAPSVPQMPQAPETAATKEDPSDEEQMCDVLSPTEFNQSLTELLLNTAPEMTGQQILEVRRSLLEFAEKHGWSDG
jgi:cold shock protein